MKAAGDLRLQDFDASLPDASLLDAALALNNAHVPAVSLLERDDLAWYATIADGFVVAVDASNDDLVGLVILIGPGSEYPSPNYAWFRDRYDSFLYVDRIVVDERGHGVGVGRRIYEEVVMARARAAGHRFVCAEVNLRPRNEPSLRFHASRGFVEVGRRTDAEGKLLAMLARPVES